MEVGECRVGIAEEHRPHAGDHGVERTALEGVDLRVGLSELHVVKTFGVRGRSRQRDHLRRQVDPERGAVHRYSCDVAGRVSGAAADVEDAVAVANGRRGEERAVAVRERLVEASGLGGPEDALVAVPCSDLPGVGRVGDQTLLGAHRGTLPLGATYTPEGSMSMAPALTSTSYAILGLLAVKPWTTYELARQMDRALGRFWPRAESKLYEEPKKLVAHGLARASSEMVGKRRRTVYTITAKGRRALAEWVPTPGAGPIVEFEQLIKVFFAEHGTKADLLATLAGVRDMERRAAGRQRPRPPGLSRWERPVSRAPPLAAPRRTVPGRLPPHGRALGRVGQRDRRDLARRRRGRATGLADARAAGDHRPGPRPRTLTRPCLRSLLSPVFRASRVVKGAAFRRGSTRPARPAVPVVAGAGDPMTRSTQKAVRLGGHSR